jgi:D-glycero-D-manno-heptose 1,7-bisphosphate phosphatase
MMARAVFLDRDGVLNRIVLRDGKPASPRSLAEFVLEPGVADALRPLDAAGFLLFAVTNQPDIRRGLMDNATLDAMSSLLLEALPLREVVACRHDDRDACDCRKPKPGMLTALAHRWRIDLAASTMIGDQDRDMACGRAAGCTTIQLQKSYNSGAGADWRVADLAEATSVILGNAQRRPNLRTG